MKLNREIKYPQISCEGGKMFRIKIFTFQKTLK